MTQGRFWSKVEKTKTCWNWTASKSSFGHGRFKINGKLKLPHRLSYEWNKGVIPKGICVLHKCDNPACVRPSHLFLGTQKDNVTDMMGKGREGTHNLKGSEFSHAKLNEIQVEMIKKILLLKKYTQKQIGKMFGVSQGSIRGIGKNISWKHVVI